jgi:hypothetical protein
MPAFALSAISFPLDLLIVVRSPLDAVDYDANAWQTYGSRTTRMPSLCFALKAFDN